MKKMISVVLTVLALMALMVCGAFAADYDWETERLKYAEQIEADFGSQAEISHDGVLWALVTPSEKIVRDDLADKYLVSLEKGHGSKMLVTNELSPGKTYKVCAVKHFQGLLPFRKSHFDAMTIPGSKVERKWADGGQQLHLAGPLVVNESRTFLLPDGRQANIGVNYWTEAIATKITISRSNSKADDNFCTLKVMVDGKPLSKAELAQIWKDYP